METVITLIFSLLTILGAVTAINKTGSYFVGILVSIIIVMLWKTFQVPLLILWDKFAAKHFPLPEIKHFYEKDLKGKDDNGLWKVQLGMRVLIITEFLEYTEENSEYFYAMVNASAEALKEEFPLFKLRYLAVQKRDAPIQYSSTLCGENGENMKKCYKAWGKTEAVFKFTERKPNKDLFIYDGGVVVDDKIVNYTAMYLFDNTLPVTVSVLDQMEANKEPEQIEEGAVQE